MAGKNNSPASETAQQGIDLTKTSEPRRNLHAESRVGRAVSPVLRGNGGRKADIRFEANRAASLSSVLNKRLAIPGRGLYKVRLQGVICLRWVDCAGDRWSRGAKTLILRKFSVWRGERTDLERPGFALAGKSLQRRLRSLVGCEHLEGRDRETTATL